MHNDVVKYAFDFELTKLRIVQVDHDAPCSVHDRSGYCQPRFAKMAGPPVQNALQIRMRQPESAKKFGISPLLLVKETTPPQLKCQMSCVGM